MEYVLSIIGLPQGSLKRALSPLGAFAEHVHDHFIPHARNNYHPHVLGHRALGLMSGLLLSVKIFTIALLAFGPVLPAFSSAITESNIIALTNQSRVQYGEAALAENPLLDQAAQNKANDMLAKGYFAHTTPSGQTPWSFFAAAGYNYLMAGENLAVNFTEAENVETAWMNSPDHRANILNNNFLQIGIGISQGEFQGHDAIFVVQEFGTPAGQQVSLSPTPTIVQTAAVPPPAAQVAPAQVSQASPAASKSATPFLETAQAAALASAPKTLGDAQNNSPVPATPPPAVTVNSGNVQLNGDNVDITANVSGAAVKVIAYFGEQAIMLSPKEDGSWAGEVAAASLAAANTTVHLEAFGMSGQTGQLQLADFSSGTIQNFNLSGSTPVSYATIFGLTFDPKAMESNFYLFFIAALLSSLVLAIAMKKHIQHLSLIANSSFTVILACMLFMGR
jgi:hypothetical protein